MLEQTVLQLFADTDKLTADQKKEHLKTFKNVCSRLQKWFIRSDPLRYADEKKRTTEYNRAVKKGEIEPIRGKQARITYPNRAIPVSMKEFHFQAPPGSIFAHCGEAIKPNPLALIVEPKFSDSVVPLLNREQECCLFGSNVDIPAFIFQTPVPTGLHGLIEQTHNNKPLSGDFNHVSPVLPEIANLGVPLLQPMVLPTA